MPPLKRARLASAPLLSHGVVLTRHKASQTFAADLHLFYARDTIHVKWSQLLIWRVSQSFGACRDCGGESSGGKSSGGKSSGGDWYDWSWNPRTYYWLLFKLHTQFWMSSANFKLAILISIMYMYVYLCVLLLLIFSTYCIYNEKKTLQNGRFAWTLQRNESSCLA